MGMSDSLFEYETLVEEALRGVVREALRQVQDYGLIDDHHFFITFQTFYPGVEMPEYLREKYPEEMTIVLQYQFNDLFVDDDQFSVVLSFNNVSEKMVIPFEAVTGFADPSVKFGLQFHVSLEELEELEELEGEITSFLSEELSDEDFDPRPPTPPKGGKKSSKDGKDSKSKAGKSDEPNVVSLDQFRKN